MCLMSWPRDGYTISTFHSLLINVHNMNVSQMMHSFDEINHKGSVGYTHYSTPSYSDVFPQVIFSPDLELNSLIPRDLFYF